MGLFDNPPYYISAYSLAVKRGFTGTLDQWLASLKGAPAEMRFENDMIQWRFNPDADTSDTGWHDLMSADELRGKVVSEVLQQALAYAAAAGNAANHAEEAAKNVFETGKMASKAASDAITAAGTAQGFAREAARTLAECVKGIGTQTPDAEGVIWPQSSEVLYTLNDIMYQGNVAGFLDLLFRNGRLHFCNFPVPETDGETDAAIDAEVYPAPVYTGDYVIGNNGYIAKVSLAVADANYNLKGTGLQVAGQYGIDKTEAFEAATEEEPQLLPEEFLVDLEPTYQGTFGQYYILKQDAVYRMELVKVHGVKFQTITVYYQNTKTVREYINGREQ